MSHRLPVAHFELFNLQSLGLAIDAFAGGALDVNGMIERAIAIKGDPHLLTQFPVDILDTAFAFGKLGVVAASAGWVRKEQWAAEALSAIAFGMLELVGRVHAQAFGTQRGEIASVSWRSKSLGYILTGEEHGSCKKSKRPL